MVTALLAATAHTSVSADFRLASPEYRKAGRNENEEVMRVDNGDITDQGRGS